MSAALSCDELEFDDSIETLDQFGELDRFSRCVRTEIGDQSLCALSCSSPPRLTKKQRLKLASSTPLSEDGCSSSSSSRRRIREGEVGIGGREEGECDSQEPDEELADDVFLMLPAKKRRRRHLVSPFPRILKSDIRRILSTMYENVMNSTDMPLIASFYNQFCVSSCRSIDYAVSSISPHKVSIKRLDGVQSIVERLDSMLPLIPDFIFQVNKSYIQQHLDKPGSKMIMEIRVRGTKLFEPLVSIIDQHNESHILPLWVFEGMQSSEWATNGRIRSYSHVNMTYKVDMTGTISCFLDSNHRIYRMEFNGDFGVPITLGPSSF